MMDSFIRKQRKITPLSDAAIELLCRDMEEIPFRRGELVVKEGKRETLAYFVKTGMARAYVERDGKDLTLWFAGEGDMLVLASQEISSVSIEMTESGILLSLSRCHLEDLFGQSLELANWGRHLLASYLLDYERYFSNCGWTGARQQYEELLREYPGLLQKVALKHIASYLQITPQSLSRIRRTCVRDVKRDTP